MKKIANSLVSEMDDMPVIDAHEHLPREEELVSRQADIFTRIYCHYTVGILLSAGWKGNRQQLADTSVPLEERWRTFKPYLHAIQHTGFARAAHITARDLYGVCEINDDTYQLLSERLQAANTPGLYQRVLKGKCNMQTVLDLGDWDVGDGSLMRCVYNLFWDLWSMDSRSFRNFYDKWAKLSGGEFEDAEEFSEFLLHKVRAEGCVGIKFAADLPSETVARTTAQTIFTKFKQSDLGDQETSLLGTWLTHRLLAKAPEHGLVVTVHCGMGSSTWEDVTLYKATNLIPIILRYRETTFDLYHASMPWVREIAVMGCKYPNVYLNLVWAHQQSPFIVERMLNEWIDLVPINKIIGFGGDNGAPEKTYGALQIAKENIARALADRITRGQLSESRAADICRAWLYDNPKKLYSLR